MNNAELLDEFCDNLWLEDGLSRNTLDSYRRDLNKFAAWLEKQRDASILQTTHGDIQGYLAQLVTGQKAKPSSTGRNISSLKRLFRYLLRQGKISADPTLQIDTPKLPRNLPKSLTEQDVESLLAAPDIQTPLGMRDRAMFEVLYATGLRVSELVTLRITQVSMDMGVVRVMGKGSKERLVPLGEEALDWLGRYMADGRSVLLGKQISDALFVTARGEGMTRQMFWYLIKKHAKQWRAGQADLAAHAAPRVRHASAESWRGFARGADVAGPCRHLHNADIHPRRPRAAQAPACQASSARLTVRTHTYRKYKVQDVDLTLVPAASILYSRMSPIC